MVSPSPSNVSAPLLLSRLAPWAPVVGGVAPDQVIVLDRRGMAVTYWMVATPATPRSPRFHVTWVNTPGRTVPSASVGSSTVTTEAGVGHTAGDSGADTSSDPDPGYSSTEPGLVPEASVVLSSPPQPRNSSPAGM